MSRKWTIMTFLSTMFHSCLTPIEILTVKMGTEASSLRKQAVIKKTTRIEILSIVVVTMWLNLWWQRLRVRSIIRHLLQGKKSVILQPWAIRILSAKQVERHPKATLICFLPVTKSSDATCWQSSCQQSNRTRKSFPRYPPQKPSDATAPSTRAKKWPLRTPSVERNWPFSQKT